MNFAFLGGQDGLDSSASTGEKKLLVRTGRCPQNHTCPSVKVCPVHALAQQGYKAPTADEDKCIKCGKCVRFCPMGVFLLK